MSEVLIVAKTQMKDRLCVGGLELDDGRSLRLLTHRGNNQPLSAKYSVGDVWELRFKNLPADKLKPPHTEDVRVIRHLFGYKMPMSDLIDTIAQYIDVPTVQPHELFGGLLQITQTKRARILRSGELPQSSTGFWRLNQDLLLSEIMRDGKMRKYYRASQSAFEVRYVGAETSRDILPAKSLLRFSMSRWFGANPGYWLQLSGWFI